MKQSIAAPRLAFIDLGKLGIETEQASHDLVPMFLGGRGVNIHLLATRFSLDLDPLDARSPLILGAGLLTGLPCPSAARMNITGKSPETGLLADSNMGGSFGVWMRRAGFDHLVVTGRAANPVYLLLENGDCRFLEARDLWGKDTQTAQYLLKRRHGEDCMTLVIGPAGENQVRFASVVHHMRSVAARGGLGCLMGSKKLKGIVVMKGAPIPIHDRPGLASYSKKLWEHLSQSPTVRALSDHGTPFLLGMHNRQGIVRTQGTKSNRFHGAARLLSSKLKRNHYTSSTGCYGCGIRCHHISEIKTGPRQGEKGEGPEYGTLSAFGPICGVDRLESIIALNNLVNHLGLDSVSTGNLIAWAIECFEAGHISERDTCGLDLKWGNTAVIMKLVKQIARRQGFGDLLARGSVYLAEHFPVGADRLVQVKGLIQSDGVDVRPLKGFALGIATSSRGADHLRSRPTMEILKLSGNQLREMYGEEISPDPTSYKGKARMVFQDERDYAIGDALGVCRFVQKFNSPSHLGLQEFLGLIRFATGLELSLDELEKVGERVTTLERWYICKLGIDRKNDHLPPLYERPQEFGPYRGQAIDNEQFEKMLTEYYNHHGWDEGSGRPSNETLERLQLDV